MGNQHTDLIEAATAASSTDCPTIYANGFAVATALGDVVVALQQNGKPSGVINLSYTVAKTLSIKLGGGINNLEEKTGNSIMTTDQVAAALSKQPSDKDEKKAQPEPRT